ncbi:MAG: SAM-dependent methyltransferase [Gammaproteobacteria bacterium]|nr:SAM-dependent methyltransferase [Gammaproteobacteria bacterium]
MKNIVIEANKQLSESILWNLQTKFYDEEGINAWHTKVPSYITSNPFIANNYALLIIRYIQALTRQNKAHPNAPFYIIELGAGHGQFSYYCMKRIFELQKTLGLEQVPICYVMTDFTEKNINYWKNHTAFASFIAEQKLDFAKYNLQESNQIELINQKVVLSQGTLENPAIIIANYIFDTVKQDAFHIEDGNTYEALVNIKTPKNNYKNKQVEKTDKLDINFAYQPIENFYYKHPILDRVLFDYRTLIKKGSFLFPIGAFHSLEVLSGLSKRGLLLISTDKGYSSLPEIEDRCDPSITFHDNCFSTSVNFHAIGCYFEKKKGEFHHQSLRNGIKTSLFSIGTKFRELPDFFQAIDT